MMKNKLTRYSYNETSKYVIQDGKIYFRKQRVDGIKFLKIITQSYLNLLVVMVSTQSLGQ